MIVAFNWTASAEVATAVATLVLAVATFSSVRSANRAARAAERSLLSGLTPLLVPTRFDDPPQKINFFDNRWLRVEGGRAEVEITDTVIYLAMGVRNVGNGIAVLDSWCLRHAEAQMDTNRHAPLEEFTRLTRDLYISAGDNGFWQGAFRDPAAPAFARARDLLTAGDRVRLEILYSDHEGGQRTISQFAFTPREDGGWIASVGRHWSLDRPGPR